MFILPLVRKLSGSNCPEVSWASCSLSLFTSAWSWLTFPWVSSFTTACPRIFLKSVKGILLRHPVLCSCLFVGSGVTNTKQNCASTVTRPLGSQSAGVGRRLPLPVPCTFGLGLSPSPPPHMLPLRYTTLLGWVTPGSGYVYLTLPASWDNPTPMESSKLLFPSGKTIPSPLSWRTVRM